MDVKKLRQTAARKEAAVDDKTLFLSPEFKDYADNMAHSVAHLPKGALSLQCDYNTKSDVTAYTNNQMIYANFGNSLVQDYKSETTRFLAAMGMLFHECAHVRFYDHPQYVKRITEMGKGKFPVEEPSLQAGEEEAFAGIKAMLANPNTCPILVRLVSTLDNYVVDYHDEQCLIRNDGAYVRYGIHTIAESIRASAPSVERMLAYQMPPLAIITNLALQYARWRSFVVEDESILDVEPTVQIVRAISPYLDAAMETDDIDSRFIQYNHALLKFWPLFKDILDEEQQNNQQKEGQQGNGSGTGSGSSDVKNSNASGDSENYGSNAQDTNGAGQSSEQESNSETENNSESENESGNGNGSESASSDASSNADEKDGGSSPDNPKADSMDGGESEQSQECGSMSKSDLNELVSQIEGSIKKAGQGALDKINADISNGMNGIGSTERPNFDKSPRKDSQKQVNDKGSETTGGASTAPVDSGTTQSVEDAAEAARAAISAIKHSIAQREAQEILSRAIYQEELITINGIPAGSNHRDQEIRVVDVPVNEENKRLYSKEMKKLRTLSLSLQRKVKDAIKIRQMDEVKHHRAFGKKIAVHDIYRRDSRFFDQKKMPGDPTDIAIAVIVDRSGSMECGVGDQCRITAAVRASLLVYDFATALHIPTMVVGHSCVGDYKSVMYLNATFDPRPGDKYRIVDQTTMGNNRDGLIINAVAEMLSRRPEQLKLLFVVSDGQPNAHLYRGDPAKKDIQQILRKYKSKGITTFATAIGSDKEMIKSIYGDGYIDISDLKTFPQRLVRMIAKRIV